MAFSFGKLMDVTAVPTGTAAPVYTNPASAKTYVSTILIHNSGIASRVMTLNNVPDSSGSLGTVSSSSQIVKIVVAASETVFFEFKYPLVLTDQNEAIFALADDSGVNVQLLGAIE